MIIEAIDTWGIDATASWMIGDSISDVIAGYKANTNTILIGNYIDEEAKDASFIFKNIFDAIDFVKTLEN
jgi:histidinol phosphatase-like enzyme